tara:strand:- start:40 stop:243 length:204 start_codon:yes stop_codon:yes gene_type:complete
MKMSKFDPNKAYSIGVWDMTFYVVDEDGNDVCDEYGMPIIFRAKNIDYSYMADGLDLDDLEEINEND